MIFKNTTLRLSLALALIELAIWLLLGVFVSYSSPTPYVALLSYSADHFGEITVAIATTFYVIFTYRLLENSETQRKHSTEPYLTIRWYQNPKDTNDKLEKMGQFAEETRRLIEGFSVDPHAIDEASMETGNRYLILELSNVRKTPVGWITLAVNGTLELPKAPTLRLRDELHLQDLQISDDNKVAVTMARLVSNPESGHGHIQN